MFLFKHRMASKQEQAPLCHDAWTVFRACMCCCCSCSNPSTVMIDWCNEEGRSGGWHPSHTASVLVASQACVASAKLHSLRAKSLYQLTRFGYCLARAHREVCKMSSDHNGTDMASYSTVSLSSLGATIKRECNPGEGVKYRQVAQDGYQHDLLSRLTLEESDQ
jgi:hypothetical protein